MAFRGIGDAATEVKMKQDQMAIQASANANASADRAAGLKEQQRQFDVSQGAQQENTAWARSQAEEAKAKDDRRFNIQQQAVARSERREERQLSMQDYANKLTEQRLAMETGQHDVQTKLAQANLDQILAAGREEQRDREYREREAMGVWGGLTIAGRQNGGVIPLKALEIANQKLGDKDNRIVGGGFDEGSGIAWFEIKNLATNTSKKIHMTPESQYAAMRAGISKQAADSWIETYKTDSSARIGMERKRLEMESAIEMDRQKQLNKQEISANDPGKRVDSLLQRAKVFNELAGDYTNTSMTKEQREDYRKTAAGFAEEAARIQRGESPQKTQELVVTPEMRALNGIPPTGTRTTKNGDVTRVAWPVGKQYHYVDFGPDGKAIPEKQTSAPQSAPMAGPRIASPEKQSSPATAKEPSLPSDKEFRYQGIQVTRDKNGNIKSATLGNDITGFRDIDPKDVMAEYEKRKGAREKTLADEQAKKKAEEDKTKEEKARREKVRSDYEAMFGKGKSFSTM